ncbi:MAG: extracellular solute-binding protein [Verrucomicrobia bacterium]|nr:extracellular solute-binding protein [Verrucomicrobiota bacterium]
MKVGKFFTRFLICAFWILLICFALYFPSWKIFPYEEKSINVFTWGDTLHPSVLKQFEDETGIKVNLSYYASNEELLVKMKATRGKGYDLVMPSGYNVELMIQDKLLKPLDHSKLNFWSNMNPILLNTEFDRGNRYSIPFGWEVYGLGVDERYFKGSFQPSWRAIYDPNFITYKIAVSNHAGEAVSHASFYLYGTAQKELTEEQFQQIRSLLLLQRDWVEAYSDFRADYFIATGNCPVGLSTSTYIKRIRPLFPSINFVVPEEGTFITIENLCIPAASTKKEYVYKFLNYVYSKQAMMTAYENYYLFPATLESIQALDLEEYEKKLLMDLTNNPKKIQFFKNIYPVQRMTDLWVEVKSF